MPYATEMGGMSYGYGAGYTPRTRYDFGTEYGVNQAMSDIRGARNQQDRAQAVNDALYAMNESATMRSNVRKAIHDTIKSIIENARV